MTARGWSMTPVASAIVAAVAAVPLASCGSERPLPLDDSSCKRALDDPESVEALEWLKTPPGPNRLGGLSTDEGLALAYRLQEVGAPRVVAVKPRKLSTTEPGLTADGLAVELPADPVRRRRLFEVYAKQVRAAGYAPRADEGQGCLYIAF
jgi:hypothetical protein